MLLLEEGSAPKHIQQSGLKFKSALLGCMALLLGQERHSRQLADL